MESKMEKNTNGYATRSLPESALPGVVPKMNSEVQLAMVYTPYQWFTKMYTPKDGLKHGTIFEELYKPLEISGGCV